MVFHMKRVDLQALFMHCKVGCGMVSYTSLCMFEGFSAVEIEVQPHEQPFSAYQTLSLGLVSEHLVSAGPHGKCFKLHATF